MRSWSALAVVLTAGACANIIGVSGYELDPSLDPGAGGDAPNGGKKPVVEGGAPVGGDDPGVGGHIVAGETGVMGGAGGAGATGGAAGAAGAADAGAATGGDAMGGGGGAAGASLGGGAGEGGEPPTCTSSKDCDDTIDCTTDTCLATGKCGHAPKDTLCDSTRCETCTVGIGCLGGPLKETQILLDPSFDVPNDDWDESGSDVANIVVSATAQSPTRIAKFGPAANNATKHEYGDLLQYITLPKGIVGLTLKGYYKLTPTTNLHPDDPDDYVALGFYDLDGGTTPVVQFHSFDGSGVAQAAWKQFSYAAPQEDMQAITKNGGDFSFDLVARAFSAFQFDTLTLTATSCQ